MERKISLEDIMRINKRNQKQLVLLMSGIFFILTGLLGLLFVNAIRYTTLNIEYILYRAIATGEYANVSLETAPFIASALLIAAIGFIILTVESIILIKEKKHEKK